MEYADIRQWVESNAKALRPAIELSSDELDHVAMCLGNIREWYYSDRPLGQFLSAVVRNDFCEACFRADDMNRKALHLYALFLHNHMPDDYPNKALAKAEGK